MFYSFAIILYISEFLDIIMYLYKLIPLLEIQLILLKFSQVLRKLYKNSFIISWGLQTFNESKF